MDVKAAPNGVATIEDRILRITGYYGYYPGYSSQKSKMLRGRPARAPETGGMWEAARSGHLQPCLCGQCHPLAAGHGVESMCAVLGAEP